MAEIPVQAGMRILTVEQIAELTDKRFGAYRRKVHDTRRAVHEDGTAEEIRALDYLCNAIFREKAKREASLDERYKRGEISLDEWELLFKRL